MQVSVETGQGLERKLTVQVPADKVASEVENRLKSMQGRVKVDGFRPGKVPLSVVKQRYESDVFQEVAGEVMQNCFRDAVIQEKLRPAGMPMIDPKELAPGKDIEFTATFEVYPDVKLTPVDKLKLERKTSEVKDADIDSTLETIRKQTLVEVLRKSETGDRITINFKGKVDGELFEGGTADNVPVELGSGSMIPGFEEQLTGLEKNAETVMKVKFPDDYQAKELAGKEAEFDTKVLKVEGPKFNEIDEAFAKELGVKDGNVETLRSNIRDDMERKLEDLLKVDFKSNVIDNLLEANPIDVPSAIVQQEAEALKQQMASRQQQQGQGGVDLPVDIFMKDAERRVKLGILLAEVVNLSKLEVTKAMVGEKVKNMSKGYEDPSEFVRYYQGNAELLQNVETLLMEEMVVEWIAEQATVKEVSAKFEDVIKPSQAG